MTTKKNDPSNLNLWNPYGTISCTLFFIYSMELGSPPLYAEVNRVCREKDMFYLPMLGPYIRAMYEITSHAQSNRKYDPGKLGSARRLSLN